MKTAFPLDYTYIGAFGDEVKGQKFGISERMYIATKIAAGLVASKMIYKNDKALIKDAFELTDELIKQGELNQ